MIRRILSFLCYILFFVMMAFLTIFYKQPLFIFVLMLLIVFPPASFFVCKYAFEHLEVSCTAKPISATSKSNVSFSILLKNTSIFPLVDCFIDYSISSAFYPCDKERELNCPSYSKGVFSFTIDTYFDKCGCYQIQLHKLTVYDYLHFSRFQKDIEIIHEIPIYPKDIETLSFSPSAYGEGFDEFEETAAKGNVSSNVTDIREYIPGDRLQKIHWKLSARINKLMVKENEQTSSNQFTLMVELYQPDETSNALEESMTYCYSMANALVEAQETFYFTFYCISRNDFSTFLIRSKEDFLMALTECFYQSPYKEEYLALETQKKAEIFKGIILYASREGVEDVII